jgi:hypothetical protein
MVFEISCRDTPSFLKRLKISAWRSPRSYADITKPRNSFIIAQKQQY